MVSTCVVEWIERSTSLESVQRLLFVSTCVVAVSYTHLHPTTIGTAREEIWGEIFEGLIPKKFVVERSVFLIDAKDNVSLEADLVIMDEMYTPYIFRYGSIKFIPIEAVAAVIQCKSTSVDKKSLGEWAESIKILRTSERAVARLATMFSTGPVLTQPSTRPILILCALKTEISNELEEDVYKRQAFL